MNDVYKLIKRFVGLLVLSGFLFFLINLLIFSAIMFKYIPDVDSSPYKIAEETANSLHFSKQGTYVLDKDISEKLEKSNAWAILIDNDTSEMIWHNNKLPSTIPTKYTLSDISNLSIGYLNGYPTYTGANKDGLVVIGFPAESFWKHTSPTWKYNFISDMPRIIISFLL